MATLGTSLSGAELSAKPKIKPQGEGKQERASTRTGSLKSLCTKQPAPPGRSDAGNIKVLPGVPQTSDTPSSCWPKLSPTQPPAQRTAEEQGVVVKEGGRDAETGPGAAQAQL